MHTMYLQVTLASKRFIIHSDKEAPQYVHVDVSSDNLLNWMIFYTNHSYMDAPQYVHIDVNSEYLCE